MVSLLGALDHDFDNFRARRIAFHPRHTGQGMGGFEGEVKLAFFVAVKRHAEGV